MLTKFANGNSLPIPTKVHRHPCSSRFRPLKLQFDNKQDRDVFIKGFNKLRHTDPAIATLPCPSWIHCVPPGSLSTTRTKKLE
uniref:Uncharacterized protein n=1 Tax=Caenorhabditis japonica TaxID=281687 RepID=A0A8R1IUT8_CAEJA